jgi:multiple sugar transport system ATP-binding protein
MVNVTLQNIRKQFGDVVVIEDLDLEINSGELCVFVGPSGCGKSTLLRMIAGLEEVTAGNVKIDDEVVNDVEPIKRGTAMVFQSYALYPHMSVYNNIAFGLKLAKTPKPEIERKVSQVAQMLQLTPYLDRLPKALSGGQRQRVAIGRALVRHPRVFLFDEPLSNLDAALRVQMRTEISRLHDQLDTTMIYVTHDQVEAMTLADRIVVLNDGRIEQVGAPLQLYHQPSSTFVAGFIGSPKMNFIQCSIDTNGVAPQLILPPSISVPMSDQLLKMQDISGSLSSLEIGIRPEHLVLSDENSEIRIEAQVDLIENLGDETVLYAELKDGQRIIARTADDTKIAKGDTISFTTTIERCHFFNQDGIRIERDSDGCLNQIQ